MPRDAEDFEYAKYLGKAYVRYRGLVIVFMATLNLFLCLPPPKFVALSRNQLIIS